MLFCFLVLLNRWVSSFLVFLYLCFLFFFSILFFSFLAFCVFSYPCGFYRFLFLFFPPFFCFSFLFFLSVAFPDKYFAFCWKQWQLANWASKQVWTAVPICSLGDRQSKCDVSCRPCDCILCFCVLGVSLIFACDNDRIPWFPSGNPCGDLSASEGVVSDCFVCFCSTSVTTEQT